MRSNMLDDITWLLVMGFFFFFSSKNLSSDAIKTEFHNHFSQTAYVTAVWKRRKRRGGFRSQNDSVCLGGLPGPSRPTWSVPPLCCSGAHPLPLAPAVKSTMPTLCRYSLWNILGPESDTKLDTSSKGWIYQTSKSIQVRKALVKSFFFFFNVINYKSQQ